MSGGSAEDADRAFRARLDALGLRDVRPLYRGLLKRLREEDTAAYEEAVRRYEEEVDAAVDGADDPVVPWLRYGAWLAERIAPGRTAAVDAGGRARDLELKPGPGAGESPAPSAEQLDIGAPSAEPDDAGTGDGGSGDGGSGGPGAGPGREQDRPGGDDPVPPGALLLHLPDDDRRRALVLALPAEPTEHQEATRDLLCG